MSVQAFVDNFIKNNPNATMEDLLDVVTTTYNKKIDEKAEQELLQEKITETEAELKGLLEEYTGMVDEYRKKFKKSPDTDFFIGGTMEVEQKDLDKLTKTILNFFG